MGIGGEPLRIAKKRTVLLRLSPCRSARLPDSEPAGSSFIADPAARRSAANGIEVTPNQGCVSSAARIDFGAKDSRWFGVSGIQHSVALSALTGSPATATLDFRLLVDLHAPRHRVAAIVFRAGRPGSGIGSPLVLAELEQTLMVALLLPPAITETGLDRDSPGAAPGQVRRAEPSTHWDQPISTSRIWSPPLPAPVRAVSSVRSARAGNARRLDHARQLRLRKARQMLKSRATRPASPKSP